MQIKALGEDHPHVAKTYNHIGISKRYICEYLGAKGTTDLVMHGACGVQNITETAQVPHSKAACILMMFISLSLVSTLYFVDVSLP